MKAIGFFSNQAIGHPEALQDIDVPEPTLRD